MIPREFSASQSGSGNSRGSKGSSASFGTTSSGNKRRSASASSGNSNKRRSSAANSGGDGLLDALSLDFSGGGDMGGFDDLDLDFDKPLDEHEQAEQEVFSPF